MPEIYDKIFARYGFRVEDYYSLKKLDPAYRVYFPDEAIDVPGTLPLSTAPSEPHSCN